MKDKLEISYFCMPAFGHLDWGGMVEALQILQNRGHHVTVASGSSLKEYIESLGLSFLDIGLKKIEPVLVGESISHALDKHQKENFFNFENIAEAYSKAKVFYDSRGLDLILSDSFSKVAQLVSSYKRIPRITVDPQIPASLITPEINQAIERASEPFRYKIEKLIQSEGAEPIDLSFLVPSKHNISFSCPEFEGPFCCNLNTYVGASPLIRKHRKPFAREKGRPNIFYSSGTLFWDTAQVGAVIRLAEKYPINLYITNANIIPPRTHPKNVKIFDFSNDSEIFPFMDLVITQGGAGTAMKAIRSGVPMVVAPLIFANYAMAEKTKRFGNGIGILAEEFTFNNLESSVLEMLENNSYKTRAEYLQEIFASKGGSIKAADFVEEYKNLK